MPSLEDKSKFLQEQIKQRRDAISKHVEDVNVLLSLLQGVNEQACRESKLALVEPAAKLRGLTSGARPDDGKP